MADGAIPSQPHDHSYFRRTPDEKLQTINNTVEYNYSLVLSAQTPRLGYRRVVHLLWERLGNPSLITSSEEQRNVLRPELNSFSSWRDEAWKTYADRVYTGFACGNKQCDTLSSDRNHKGEWDHPEPDVWFNPWFQALRTAYGWYVYDRIVMDLPSHFL